MSWNEIETDPTFQALPAERKARIKNNYFEKEIAPKVPSRELDEVRKSFFEGPRFSDNDKATNDAVASIGGIIHRAIPTMPEFQLMRDRLVQGVQSGTKLGLETAAAIPKALIMGPIEAGTALGKVPIPGSQLLAKGIEETAGGVASEVSRTLALKGHEKLAVPAGVATSILSGPGAVDLAVPKEMIQRDTTIGDVAFAYAMNLTGAKIVQALSAIPSLGVYPASYVLKNILYKMGLPIETSPVIQGSAALRAAVTEGRVSLAEAMRSNPEIFKEELNKRGLTPPQIKERPPVTPEESSAIILKAEDLHSGAAKSAQVAPRTFTASTSISEVPTAAATRIGAYQGQINYILGLPPGTPITPESYHRAMQTGKLNRIEALEIDEMIFKAEATKEGIPEELQGELFRQAQVAGQKPVEFQVMKALADDIKKSLSPQLPPSPAATVPEFHEMTKEAFAAEAAKLSGGAVGPELASQVHQDIIEQAIGEGQTVPPEAVESHAPIVQKTPKVAPPPWSAERFGWATKEIARPGISMERGDDLVIKTASGKFKAYREENLVGEYATQEEAAKAVDNIDEDEAQRQEAEGKEMMKQMGTPTPAMDLARRYGLSKKKLQEGRYEGEAENLKGRGIIKSKGGLSPDSLAEKMFEEGVIPEYDLNRMWDILDKEARLGPKSQIKAFPTMGTFESASKGAFAGGTPQEPANIEDFPIKKAMPLEMPEMVRLSRELLGRYPDISRRMGKQTLGLFTTRSGVARIKLRPELFKDTDQVAKTLAHEIGHANDYFPEETLARGNIIGRIASLRKYMSDTFGGDLEDNIPGIKYTAKELKRELVSLSEFWRPYNRDNAAPPFIKYRESAKELYADALSVFLNSPGMLQKMAPKFFESLMDNLDRKPAFKEEWLNIQDLLNGARADTLKSRREDIRQMGMKSEEILIRKQIEKSMQLQSNAEQLAQGLTDRYFPILKMANELEAKGVKIPDHLNPKYVLQEGDMVGNDIAMMDLKLDDILNPLRQKYGLGPIELHEYGFNNRILHDRSELANPLGMDVKAAQENLDYLKSELGDEAFGALQTAFDATQEVFWPVIEEADQIGVINHALFVSTIIPNKGNYVAFSVLEHLEKTGYISATIQEQKGTLKEIGNTWLATRMKVAATMARNLDQKNKLSFKYVMDSLHPGEMSKTQISRMGPGMGIEKPGPGKEILYLYEDGKRVPYDVDPYIAQAFEKWKPAQMNLVVRALNLTSYPFKLMYTIDNAGFAFFTSPLRYFQKTYKGLSGVQGAGVVPLLANYFVSIPDRFSMATGRPNELVRQLIESKALDVSMEDLELVPELNSYSQKARKYELEQIDPSDQSLLKRTRDKLLYPIRQIMHGMQVAADTTTGAWKIAAARIRLKAGEGTKEMAYNVRNYAGIPNPRVKGLWAQATNSFFLFGNILQRHMMTAYQVLTMPKTKGGARLKTAALDVVPAMYQTLAALGLLGAALKEFYERYSKYERRHYTLIPLGTMKGGEWGWKSVGLPIPHDDAGRIIHAMTTEIITALYNQKPREFQAMVGELFSTLPGLTPALEIPRVWIQEYTGGKAWDSFRQRTVIPDRVEKIGGLLKLEKMLEWTMNETGLTNFQSYNPDKRTTTEVVIQATPLLNRMIKISDYGKKEKFREEMEDSPFAEEAYRLRQKKKEGPLSREEALRLQVIQYQARQHRIKVKQQEAKEKAP